jgi:hypothetical protein
MNKIEALATLRQELAEWRKRSHGELVTEVGKCSHSEAVAPSGVRHQIDVQVFWDEKPGGPVRVLGAIDDFGVRAFSPLSDDFIVAPDGSFVGKHAV